MNKILYENAMDSIRRLFEDKSVSKEECAENLQGLKDEIDILLESLNL